MRIILMALLHQRMGGRHIIIRTVIITVLNRIRVNHIMTILVVRLLVRPLALLGLLLLHNMLPNRLQIS